MGFSHTLFLSLLGPVGLASSAPTQVRAAATPDDFDLLCTANYDGKPLQTLFSVSVSMRSYTANDGGAHFNGTAEIKGDQIVLVRSGGRIVWTYDVNMISGDYELSGGLPDGSPPVERAHGTCQKQAFEPLP